jgi:hypothetical protein
LQISYQSSLTCAWHTHNPVQISFSIFSVATGGAPCIYSWSETNPFQFRVDTKVDGRITREKMQEVSKSGWAHLINSSTELLEYSNRK